MPVELSKVSAQPKGKFDAVFFGHFGPESLALAESLAAAGATFMVGHKAITAYFGADQLSCSLPIPSTAIIKAAVPPYLKDKVLEAVRLFLEEVAKKLAVQPPLVTGPKSAPAATAGVTPAQVAQQMEALSSAEVAQALKMVKEKYPTLYKLVADQGDAPLKSFLQAQQAAKAAKQAAKGIPVKLKDAQSIGQPVLGTSDGSVYRVVALGERVKLAIKMDGDGFLSLRAEGEMTDAERAALVKLGFTDKDKYLSCHVGMGTVPAERMLGCLFFDPDLEFQQRIGKISEVAS